MTRHRFIAGFITLLLLLSLAASMPPFEQQARGATPSPTPNTAIPSPIFPLDPAITATWQRGDGAVLRGETARPWLWGPAAITSIVEYAPGTPTGVRREVYFDKGRLDIDNPGGDANSQWFATGANLVTELLSGSFQVGNTWVRQNPANVAVVGDPVQPNPITYALLGQFASIPPIAGSAVSAAFPEIGAPVTRQLLPSGEIIEDGEASSTTVIGTYDATTGHNVAQPFSAWEQSQPFPEHYLLGHPLTEPYWIDTQIGGTQTRVLIQAFERRILSYAPHAPAPWQVESNNVGIHYREWRGLATPQDPMASALASVIPFGEVIVGAAAQHGVDPFLMAAISEVLSDGNPFAAPSPFHRGLLGVQVSGDVGVWDPAKNASMAAAQIAALKTTTTDLSMLLGAYYHGSSPTPADQADHDFANAVTTAMDALRARFTAPETPSVSQPLPLAGTRQVQVLDGHLDAQWWAQSLAWYANWGGVVAGWQGDPLGYWCVAPGYAPGDRLRLITNDVSIDCTIGALSGEMGLPQLSDAGLGLSASASQALGAENGTQVDIYHLGPAAGQRSASAKYVGNGPAAYYAASYDRAWWDSTLQLHVGWGNSVSNWSLDANGFYCVNPDYLPGTRLRLVANGVTLDCTIGDSVQSYDEAQWRAHWAVEMSWDTFVALGLPNANFVRVFVIP